MQLDPNSINEQHVARVFIQLDFYLRTLKLPFQVKHLYSTAYKKRLGEYYSDVWIDRLLSNPKVDEYLEESYTIQSIVETLMNAGYEPIIRALMREVKKRKIGFTQAYLMGINHWRE